MSETELRPSEVLFTMEPVTYRVHLTELDPNQRDAEKRTTVDAETEGTA